MKNVNKPLAEGYFNLLNGIVVEGKTVALHYLKAVYPTEAPYMVITGMYTQNENDNSDFWGYTTVDLNIYTEFQGDFGSMNLADEIANALMEILMPAPGVTPLQAEGFNVSTCKMRGSRDYNDTSDDKSTYEKKITLEHLIFQI